LETPAIKSKADKSKSTSPSSVPKSSVNTILPYWTEISYEEPKDNFNEALLEQFGIKPESKIRNTFQTENGHRVVFIYPKYLKEETCEALKLHIPEGTGHSVLLWRISGETETHVLSGINKVFPFDKEQIIIEQDSGEYFLNLRSGERRRAPRGCTGIPVCTSMRVFVFLSGIELYQQRGDRLIWLHGLDKGGRQYFYDDTSHVVGLLKTDSKDKQWLYLVSIKGGKLHHNRTMKVPGDMLADWRDTEIFQKDGRIMMRTKSFVEKKQQWVLENLEVVAAKHNYEKDRKKTLRELAKDNKKKGGMGFVPIDRKLTSLPSKHVPITTKNEKGEVFWRGSDGNIWVFVPDDGVRYERITHGTYMLQFQHPNGQRVDIDLGLTDGIYDGFPNLCGNFLPRLANNRGWNSHERTVQDIMSIQLMHLQEYFYATVFDNGQKSLVYCEMSEKVFEVDLNTGKSKLVVTDFSGQVFSMEVRPDRTFFIQSTDSFCTGCLDHPDGTINRKGHPAGSVIGHFGQFHYHSLRVDTDVILMYGHSLHFKLLWNHPIYYSEAIEQKEKSGTLGHEIYWLSFSLPCSGLDLVQEGNRLFAVNERYTFEFKGFTQALSYLREVWPKAERDSPKIPDEGWGNLY